MKNVWIIFTLLSFLILGCGPSARIQKTYIQMDQQKTGPIEVFNSFDEVGRPYKKVAELEITNPRSSIDRIRERLIASLKTKALELGADGIVIVEEETKTSRTKNPFGGKGWVYFHGLFIKCTAITFG